MTTLEIGGKNRPFKIDYRAIREAKTELGIRTQTMDVANFGDSDITDLLDHWLFIGLWAQDKSVTKDQVDEWLNSVKLAPVVMAVTNDLAELFIDTDEEDEKKPAAPPQENISMTGTLGDGPKTSPSSSLDAT